MRIGKIIQIRILSAASARPAFKSSLTDTQDHHAAIQKARKKKGTQSFERVPRCRWDVLDYRLRIEPKMLVRMLVEIPDCDP